ncbi:MAG: PaaI family thioesterase [Rhodobiaceae bacterium]|nr:PaaI family thioesterase [Rhodobiaceae bacterium]
MTDLTSLDGIQAALDASPFQKALGLRAVSFDPVNGAVEFVLPFHDAAARKPEGDQLHGGVLVAVMDIAGDYALGVCLGHLVPTISLYTDFLRPSHGTVRVVANVVRCGRSIGVTEMSVFAGDDTLVAAGRGTYSTRPG